MNREHCEKIIALIGVAGRRGIDQLIALYPRLKHDRWQISGGDNDPLIITLPYHIDDSNAWMIVQFDLEGDFYTFTVLTLLERAGKRRLMCSNPIDGRIPSSRANRLLIRFVIAKSFRWTKNQLSAPLGGAN